MSNIFGRQLVLLLTNKSGGSVVKGDVVILDTGNDTAFTTTTSAGVTVGVGIAQETIANNATGRVLMGGYADLVNVNASVTRGQYGKTHTVAKQATGTAVRAAGTFCQWLTGGTTPTALVYPTDLLGSSLTDPTSARGEIIRRGASALEALQAKTAGKVLVGDGTDVVSAYPPGYEFDYAEKTSNTTISATAEATPTDIVTGGSVSYDGATAIWLEFFAALVQTPSTAGDAVSLYFYDGSTSLGLAGNPVSNSAGNSIYGPLLMRRKVTPSAAAHTYKVGAIVTNASRTGLVLANVGGAGNIVPAFLRITKA